MTKADTTVQMQKFDYVRTFLDTNIPRLIVVTGPLKVVIDDLPKDYEEMCEVPFSKEASFGTHTVPSLRPYILNALTSVRSTLLTTSASL